MALSWHSEKEHFFPSLPVAITVRFFSVAPQARDLDLLFAAIGDFTFKDIYFQRLLFLLKQLRLRSVGPRTLPQVTGLNSTHNGNKVPVLCFHVPERFDVSFREVD